MILRMAVLAPLVVLVGCGEAAYLSYQGRPAETALECKAAYEEAKDRSRNVSVGTDRGSLIGAAIGRGIVESSVNSAYNECLARVSALPGGGMSTKVPAATAAPTGVTSGCSRGGGVMQGGTGYCTR